MPSSTSERPANLEQWATTLRKLKMRIEISRHILYTMILALPAFAQALPSRWQKLPGPCSAPLNAWLLLSLPALTRQFGHETLYCRQESILQDPAWSPADLNAYTLHKISDGCIGDYSCIAEEDGSSRDWYHQIPRCCHASTCCDAPRGWVQNQGITCPHGSRIGQIDTSHLYHTCIFSVRTIRQDEVRLAYYSAPLLLAVIAVCEESLWLPCLRTIMCKDNLLQTWLKSASTEESMRLWRRCKDRNTLSTFKSCNAHWSGIIQMPNW